MVPRPKTNPSLASMLTGLYPFRHGVRSTFTPMTSINSLPMVLSQNGFFTAAFVSNFNLAAENSNFNLLFDYYNANFTTHELNRKGIKTRSAQDTNKAVFKFLDDEKDNKFFLWVHYIEPHGPYLPPTKYRRIFNHSGRSLITKTMVPSYQQLPWPYTVKKSGKVLTDRLDYVDAYDDYISYADSQFGELMKRLDYLGLKDNTIVILTSDHGESLGEHNYYFEHGAVLYDDNIRIPLIIRLPKKDKVSISRTDALVSNMDIYPTVLDLLGIEGKSAGDIDGISFLPALKGGPGSRIDFFSEVFSTQKRYLQKAAVRTQNLKMIRLSTMMDVDGNNINKLRYMCFNISSDKKETKYLNCSHPGFLSLNASLEKFVNKVDTEGITLQKRKPSKADVAALKSLGYVA
jgi:arylsulfatase A-like enzyme